MFGSESAIEGAMAEERGGRIEDAERDDSNAVAIVRDVFQVWSICAVVGGSEPLRDDGTMLMCLER